MLPFAEILVPLEDVGSTRIFLGRTVVHARGARQEDVAGDDQIGSGDIAVLRIGWLDQLRSIEESDCPRIGKSLLSG